MAQLLVATAGAAAGFAIGGPLGASIGWSIGSVVGASFTRQTVEQPVASDLTVSVASYGAPLPIRFGSWKGGGVIFWHSDKFRAVRSETTSGGKGGPKVTTVSYTYEIDVAVAVNDGVAGGVSRIWLDGKPVFDMREDGALQTVAASLDWCSTLTVYQGDETQLPDPTMEEALGAGNVPAYRGVCYVVIRGLKCGTSPRLPNIEFEVATAQVDPPILLLDGRLRGNSAASGTQFQPQARVVRVMGDMLYVNYGDGVHSVRYPISDLGLTVPDSPVLVEGSVDETWPCSCPIYDPSFMIGTPSRGLVKNSALVQVMGALVYGENFIPVCIYFRGLNQSAGATESYPSLRAGFKIGIGQGWTINDGAGDVEWINRVPFTPDPSSQAVGAAGCADTRRFMILYEDGWTIWKINGYGIFSEERTGTYSGGTPWMAYGVGPTAWNGLGEESFRKAACLESDLKHYWVTHAASTIDGYAGDGVGVQCWEINDADEMVLLFEEFYEISNSLTPKAIFADNGIAWIVSPIFAGEDDVLTVITRLPMYTNEGVGLDKVVSDLYDLTGNSAASDLTVSGLSTKTVRGFEVTGPRPVRQAIDTLRSGFFFDAVESDARLKFILRGGSSAASIESTDLVVTRDAAGALVTAERQFETEIPRQVTVDYVSSDGDYRRGSQMAQRATTGSDEVLAVQMPIVFTDDEAAQVADILLRARWRERSSRQFSVGRKWSKLEPTDVIDVSDGDFTYRVRITSDRRADGMITFDAADEGGATYTSGATGGAIQPPDGMTYPSTAKLAVLDVPPLRDQDSGYQYLAAAPYSGTTLGVEVLKSRNNGTTWASLAPLTSVATIGVCTTALGDGRTDLVDETNTVTVQIMAGSTLASVTYDQLLEGLQYAAIGVPGRWEIVGFAGVVDEGDGLYTISRLLRGRLGTEDAIATHAVGDYFVLLDQSTLARVAIAPAERDTTALYAAVPFGRSIDTTSKLTVPIEVRSLKPLAPAHLSATLQPNGDIVIRWVRRGRLDAGWRDYVDVPLDESEELYDVDVFRVADNAVVRSFAVDVPTLTYTSAQRSADTSGVSPLIGVSVYQRSASLGRGVPATISPAGTRTYSRNWNDESQLSEQRLVGSGGTPKQSIYSGQLMLQVGASGDQSVQCFMDWIPSFSDGTVELDMEKDSSSYWVWLAVRTTYSGYDKGQAGYTWRIINSTGEWYLEKGTNSAVNTSTVLASGTLSIYSGTARFELSGSSIALYWNDELLAAVTDTTHLAAGAVAIGVKAASSAADFLFDNLVVQAY